MSQPEKRDLEAKLEELKRAERERDVATSFFEGMRNCVDTTGELELFSRLVVAEERVRRIARELEQGFGLEPE